MSSFPHLFSSFSHPLHICPFPTIFIFFIQLYFTFVHFHNFHHLFIYSTLVLSTFSFFFTPPFFILLSYIPLCLFSINPTTSMLSSFSSTSLLSLLSFHPFSMHFIFLLSHVFHHFFIHSIFLLLYIFIFFICSNFIPLHNFFIFSPLHFSFDSNFHPLYHFIFKIH